MENCPRAKRSLQVPHLTSYSQGPYAVGVVIDSILWIEKLRSRKEKPLVLDAQLLMAEPRCELRFA